MFLEIKIRRRAVLHRGQTDPRSLTSGPGSTSQGHAGQAFPGHSGLVLGQICPLPCTARRPEALVGGWKRTGRRVKWGGGSPRGCLQGWQGRGSPEDGGSGGGKLRPERPETATPAMNQGVPLRLRRRGGRGWRGETPGKLGDARGGP
jgi:hypothetical protein